MIESSAPGRRAAVPAQLAGTVVLGAAFQEGPGYGGTADTLSVRWVDAADAALAHVVTPAGERLRFDGYGFRSNSEVSVRIGSTAEIATQADGTGTMVFTITPRTVDPGVSAIAVGVTPSGSKHILLGTVPPLPASVDLVSSSVWVILTALVLLLGVPRLHSLLRKGSVRRTWGATRREP